MNKGDTVYIDASRYSTIDVCKGEVISVSATGVVRCAIDPLNGYRHECSFMPNGRERGHSGMYASRLIDAETYAKLAERQSQQARERNARNAIEALRVIPCTAARKDELIAAASAALSAIERI